MIDPVVPRRPSNLDAPQSLPPATPDRHAEAIAQVTLMRDTIRQQNELIIDLKREVQIERDRVQLLLEESARWRTDAMACRTFVVKLATIQESIHTATVGAAAILDDMARMDDTVTEKIEVSITRNTIEEQLRKLRDIENGETSVASMQEGAQIDAGEHEVAGHSLSNESLNLSPV